ncbi:MAG: AAA family ATPase [Treponema sp.]|nr:AAA family ATPase [Treponema sp.]
MNIEQNTQTNSNQNVNQKIKALINGACRVIRGKHDFLELLAAGIFAGGHILLEDNPGLGKTTVAKTMARLIEGSSGRPLVFKRIQFTPDLLPYDITGVDIFDPETRSFRFMPGPILANIVLADEINRATPKVQSALLEVMAEGQVTIGDASHRPPQPFFVIATGNPIESEGTFPLPCAQLDRFMMRLSLGYPDRESELSILDDNPAGGILESLEPIMTCAEFLEIREAVKKVFCHPSLKEAAADIVRDTRTHRGFSLGVSPRGALHYLEAAKALALIRDRDYIIDEDLLILAVPVLSHRVRLKDVSEDTSKAQTVIREISLARLESIKQRN